MATSERISASTTELAWAAGFIDGEGCLSFGRNLARRMPFVPELTVGNTDKQALERLKEMFGGSISVRRRTNPRHQVCWAWSISGSKRLRLTLEALRPFLVCKDDQADVLLEFCALVRPAGGRQPPLPPDEYAKREALVARLHALKGGRRGKRVHPLSAVQIRAIRGSSDSEKELAQRYDVTASAIRAARI